MKRPLIRSLVWYILGVLTAVFPCSVYMAGFSYRPIFISPDGSMPDFWTKVWNNFPDNFVASIETSGLVIFITTPLYLLLRFLFHCRSCTLGYIFTTAWLAGFINFCLSVYVLVVIGMAVKGTFGRPLNFDDYLRNFADSGGIFAMPFITTLIAFLPTIVFSQFFQKPSVS